MSQIEMAAEFESSGHDSRANLVLLETRLRRLEFLLAGQSNLDGAPHAAERTQRSTDSVISRLSSLQADLDSLRKSNGVAGDVVRDVESVHAECPKSLLQYRLYLLRTFLRRPPS